MISAAVIEALKEIVPAERILFQEPMKLHTTFRIGGPADCLIYLENEEQLCKMQKYLRLVDVPYTVIGNGSNLLVSDNGYSGIVLVIGKCMSRITVLQTKCHLCNYKRLILDHTGTVSEFHGAVVQLHDLSVAVDYGYRCYYLTHLEYPSAGSTFKRPEGYYAGKLIMDAGLRGYSIGGAGVSEKHCGFVINKGKATAADVAEVIQEVQERIKKKFGVTLETEVIFLGDF